MKHNIKIKDIKYYVNEEKKTVVCVAEYTIADSPDKELYKVFQGVPAALVRSKLLKQKGISKCSGTDIFDTEIGKRIAKARALREVYRSTQLLYQEGADSLIRIANRLLNASDKCRKSADGKHRQLQTQLEYVENIIE